MNTSSYKDIQQLIKDIAEKVNRLEDKKLNLSEINILQEDARNLYERLTIIRYKAFEETLNGEIKQETSSNNAEENETTTSFIKFNITAKPEEIIPKNQTNLIDQINEITTSFENTKSEIELNEAKPTHSNQSINERMASSQTEKISLAEKLKKTPITDIKASIGLNQKFLFMNDLFEGEKAHYDEALDKLNSLNNYLDADDFIKNDLKQRFNWDMTAETTQQFLEIIERRYL